MAEHKNRTSLSKMSAILKDACLQKTYWRGALHYASYFYNRVTSRKKNNPSACMILLGTPSLLMNVKILMCVKHTNIRKTKSGYNLHDQLQHGISYDL